MTLIELLNAWMIPLLIALCVVVWAIFDNLAHIFGRRPTPKVKVECACDHDETVVALEDVSAALGRLATAQEAAGAKEPEKVKVTKFVQRPVDE